MCLCSICYYNTGIHIHIRTLYDVQCTPYTPYIIRIPICISWYRPTLYYYITIVYVSTYILIGMGMYLKVYPIRLSYS